MTYVPGTEYGGVGYLLVASFVQTTGCKFSQNTAGINGGVFQIDTSIAKVSFSTLSSNDADSKGGVLNAVNSSITFIDCTFTSNGKNAVSGGVVSLAASSTFNSFKNTYLNSQVIVSALSISNGY